MKFIRSFVGLLLTLIAAVVAVAFVVADKLKQWKERRDLKANEARLRKEIDKIHELVDQQRDMFLKRKKEEFEAEEKRQKARDPVDFANEIINEKKDAKR